MNFPIKFYRGLIKFGVYFAPVALLIMRLGWGWQLFVSGRGHLSHDGLQNTTEFFQSLHIPMPRASVIISGSTELVGGILIMIGLAARAIAIPLAFNFCVAYATASRDKLTALFTGGVDQFSDHFYKVIDDSAFPFLIMSLIILSFGPGIISFDGLLKKTAFKKYSAGLER